jgi:hypothetical protein
LVIVKISNFGVISFLSLSENIILFQL